jgi:hypothetical protein
VYPELEGFHHTAEVVAAPESSLVPYIDALLGKNANRLSTAVGDTCRYGRVAAPAMMFLRCRKPRQFLRFTHLILKISNYLVKISSDGPTSKMDIVGSLLADNSSRLANTVPLDQFANIKSNTRTFHPTQPVETRCLEGHPSCPGSCFLGTAALAPKMGLERQKRPSHAMPKLFYNDAFRLRPCDSAGLRPAFPAFLYCAAFDAQSAEMFFETGCYQTACPIHCWYRMIERMVLPSNRLPQEV